MYSISTSRAARRLSLLRCGSMSARKSTKKRMPSGKALKRCNKRLRGETVARRYCTSATASSAVPTSAANLACAALVFCASATNCSLISSHMSRRSLGAAHAYQCATPLARMPPSTSLTCGSMMARNSSSVRRSTRGDSASSFCRKVAFKRSRVLRPAICGSPLAITFIAVCACINWPAGTFCALFSTFSMFLRPDKRETLRLSQSGGFMLPPASLSRSLATLAT